MLLTDAVASIITRTSTKMEPPRFGMSQLERLRSHGCNMPFENNANELQQRGREEGCEVNCDFA